MSDERFCLAGGYDDPTPRDIEDALAEAQRQAQHWSAAVRVCRHDGTGAAECAAWVFPDRLIDLMFLESKFA